MARTARILDRLAGDERIAADWVASLRAADAGIDSKIDVCLAQVAAVGSYLPVELEKNSVIWRAIEMPLEKVRVLILGQDPYPDPARATGLSFSTGPSGDIPASLANIYEELVRAGYAAPATGDLSAWTAKGVMLLNRALTLSRDEQPRPKRHIRWWSPLAVTAMKAIRAEAEARPIAAMLWGVPAHGRSSRADLVVTRRSQVERGRGSSPVPPVACGGHPANAHWAPRFAVPNGPRSGYE